MSIDVAVCTKSQKIKIFWKNEQLIYQGYQCGAVFSRDMLGKVFFEASHRMTEGNNIACISILFF